MLNLIRVEANVSKPFQQMKTLAFGADSLLLFFGGISSYTIRNQHKQTATVHIRFCYDKSAETFSFWKFTLWKDPILNPVDAAISILHRVDLLGVPVNEPAGVYGRQSGYYFLHDSYIRDILRLICI
jgi:hypothetical protein